MQDEARHVTFGRLALRDYYPQLTDAERDEREEFCVDACYLMRDRFLGEEVWERIGLPAGGGGVRRAQRAHGAVPQLPVHAHRARSSRTSGSGARASRVRSPTWASSSSPRPTSTPRWRTTRPRPRSSTPEMAQMKQSMAHVAAVAGGEA